MRQTYFEFFLRSSPLRGLIPSATRGDLKTLANVSDGLFSIPPSRFIETIQTRNISGLTYVKFM